MPCWHSGEHWPSQWHKFTPWLLNRPSQSIAAVSDSKNPGALVDCPCSLNGATASLFNVLMKNFPTSLVIRSPDTLRSSSLKLSTHDPAGLQLCITRFARFFATPAVYLLAKSVLYVSLRGFSPKSSSQRGSSQLVTSPDDGPLLGGTAIVVAALTRSWR